MAIQGNWGRLRALLSAARNRQHCLQKRKTRAKCQFQKNMQVGAIRERLKGDSGKQPGESEEPANGPMNLKLDFKVNVIQRG